MDKEIQLRFPRLRRYALVGVGGVVLAATAAWMIFGRSAADYNADSAGLLVGTVERGQFTDFVRISGRVETATVVQISALETGVVESRAVEEGAMVHAGDVILTLRNPGLQQQILDSESQLAEKQNMLRDTELAMQRERLQLRQDLLAARTELGRMQRAASQQDALYRENLTSREDWLKAREDADLARQNVALLLERLRQDSLYRGVQMDMMRESLRNMQQNFALVRGRADNLCVRASHDGQLGSLDAELGQNIVAGQQVGAINVPDNYKLAVAIDEHYIDRVAPGITGNARLQGRDVEVRVRKVYPEVKAGAFRADLDIVGDRPANLRVGQSCNVELRLGESSEAVLVPRGSFFQSSGGRYVYVLDADGSHAVRRRVKLGRQNPQYYEILSGLEPGEQVIISSYSKYGDAETIEIR